MQIRTRPIPGRPATISRRLALGWIAIVLVGGIAAACSSTPTATQGPGGGGGPSQAPVATIPPIPSVAIGGGGGGGGGGSAAGGDVEAIGKALAPPDSSEVTKTTAQDTWFVVYQSTESLDSLKSFYESAIPKAGMQIISTTTANGGVAWVIATDANASFGGAVSVVPTGDGKMLVQVTVGKS